MKVKHSKFHSEITLESSKDAPVFVITDIHEQLDSLLVMIAKIHTENPESLIILNGDFFDSFESNEYTVFLLCEFLANLQHNKRFILHYGNHDIGYQFPYNMYLRCTGYRDPTRNKVQQYIPQWAHKNWYWKVFTSIDRGKEKNPLIVSHAGLQEANPDSRDLEKKIDKSVTEISYGQDSWLTSVGVSRRGSAAYGGPLWCDWRHEFRPIEGVDQIVGHTKLPTLAMIAESGKSYMISEEESRNPKLQDPNYVPGAIKELPDGLSKNWNIDRPGNMFAVAKITYEDVCILDNFQV